MNPLLQLKITSLPVLTTLMLTCLTFAPQARAQTCQDGCDLNTLDTFLGLDALVNNTTGENNTATGAFALSTNTTGADNTATGASALSSNTTGGNNTAIGSAALFNNTTAILNTAVGAFALFSNTGSSNTATGNTALFNNTTGTENTGTGSGALYNNKTGSNNTAVGFNALRHNPSGSNNIALGFEAGFNLNTSDNIDIGNKGVSGEAGTIRIGTTGSQINAYVAGISGVTVPTGVAVIVDSSGHLGTTTSSARYKENVQPMDKASEAILALKPVTFRYKKDLDPERTPQFGLVAEEVEKVSPDLVARDDQGKPYTVRYDAVNAMLLNEFLKEHRTVQEQGATVARLEKQVEMLTAGLQKVSAELEQNKSGPQIVLNNP